jgi:KDO2-lipid IV(A) lauroyltransferase
MKAWLSRRQMAAEALLVRALLALLRRLGPARASDLGAAVAGFLGPLLPVSRVARDNLRRALPELDAAARARVLREVWRNLGRVAGELPHLPNLRRTEAGPGFELVGEQHLRAIQAQGGPAIFFSAHIGNWELCPATTASLGMRLSNFYRAAKNTAVDRLIGDLRAAAATPAGEAPVPNFPKGARGARAALQHLSRGGLLGMLVDQKMNDGISVPFFGRPAMTAPAAAAYALRFRCPLLPAHAERLGPARLRVIIGAPLPLPDTGDRQADIATLTAEMNRHIEGWIRARPGEWLWLHRRWPKEEKKDVLF